MSGETILTGAVKSIRDLGSEQEITITVKSFALPVSLVDTQVTIQQAAARPDAAPMPWEVFCRNCTVDEAIEPGGFCKDCAESEEARQKRALQELPLNDPNITPELAQKVLDRCSHMLSSEFKELYERRAQTAAALTDAGDVCARCGGSGFMPYGPDEQESCGACGGAGNRQGSLDSTPPCPKCASADTAAYSTRFRTCGACGAIYYVTRQEMIQSGNDS